ncbi:MAG: hydrogenase 4 subunit F [Nitrospirota bacterium]
MIAVTLLLTIPLGASLLSLGLRTPKSLYTINFAAMTFLGGAQALLMSRVLRVGSFLAYDDLVHVDALASIVLLVITTIGFTSSLYAWRYFDHHLAEGTITPHLMRRYFSLFHLFMFAMILATLANSLGILWVAIEATTLATTFLINFFGRKASLEAGWKYLILCSVGIALALFGTVLMYSSSVRALGDVSAALNITELLAVAGRLDPYVVKLAFVFILVGYGTKIGLVPMHTWVPEAYGEAPAPVTAMLAGVLETVAFYAVLRSKVVVDAVVSPEYAGNLLITFGLLSFVVSALFILVQRDYKRLFAYSSIEHMGIAAIGFGASGVGTFGALFHLINHAFSKSLAFFAAGNIHMRFGTRDIDGVRGLLKAQPWTATALLVAALALVGMPPLSMFVSEFSILAALATRGYAADTIHLGRFLTIMIADEARNLVLVFAFTVIAVVVFGGLFYRVAGMVWGDPPEGVSRGEKLGVSHIPLGLGIGALMVLGVAIPRPLRDLMGMAVDIITVR